MDDLFKTKIPIIINQTKIIGLQVLPTCSVLIYWNDNNASGKPNTNVIVFKPGANILMPSTAEQILIEGVMILSVMTMAKPMQGE